MVTVLALPLIMMRWFFYPVSRLLIRITGFIDNRISLKEDQTSLEDLKHAIDLASSGEEDREEKDILKGIVNFSNIPVRSIMRARVDVIAAEINTPLEALIEHINAHNYSRLPLYEENLDHVIGVLHIKDLLPLMRENSEDMDLRSLLRPAHFVPENKKIDALLEEFKSRRLHMAVVVDEFGGTAGVVTLEDVIEEIFGEISDEFDSEDWVYTKVSESIYVFEGRISLNDVRRIVDLDEKVFEDARGDSDSLGGLILEIHGKIPTPGEVISYRHFDFHIEAVSKNRIAMVKMIINEPIEERNS
jgi:putative hemolysin